MNALLSASPAQIMNLWEDLMSILHGVHGYGTFDAEIYISRFMEKDAYAELQPDSDQARDGYARANRLLYELCRTFEERQEVSLHMVTGMDRTEPLDVLVSDPANPFRHRVVIGIDPADARAMRIPSKVEQVDGTL